MLKGTEYEGCIGVRRKDTCKPYMYRNPLQCIAIECV